ncbi:MAG: hypothetical protein L0Y71_22805 [Gemmataceae bacterium]|nr:hypothetical protein [Gemmataceae bacterium]
MSGIRSFAMLVEGCQRPGNGLHSSRGVSIRVIRAIRGSLAGDSTMHRRDWFKLGTPLVMNCRLWQNGEMTAEQWGLYDAFALAPKTATK